MPTQGILCEKSCGERWKTSSGVPPGQPVVAGHAASFLPIGLPVASVVSEGRDDRWGSGRRFLMMVRSRSSRRIEPIQRSANVLATGVRTGVLRNRLRADRSLQAPVAFVVYAPVPPRRVRSCKPHNEVPQLDSGRWSAMTAMGRLSPEAGDSLPVPTQQGFGCDDPTLPDSAGRARRLRREGSGRHRRRADRRRGDGALGAGGGTRGIGMAAASLVSTHARVSEPHRTERFSGATTASRSHFPPNSRRRTSR